MPDALPPQYQPHDHEAELYRRWETAGVFAPPAKRDGETPFSILMPPPNANGALHVGHAVFVTLQDLMVRYHRMKGDATVWFPGLDHAGFETQVVFEKYLEKQGKSRFGMPRDEFYRATMAFVKEHSSTIVNQFRRLGASADWSRLKFTLDPDVVERVCDTFVALHDDGLAYRAARPVHWCTKHQTTLSDLEVKDELRTDPLYYLKYGPLVVATGRPETIFGDVAVAVHPDDERYQALVGTEIEIDLGTETRRIPVVADEMVDRAFGTGAVKITPAHDANDFEVAKRHGLPIDQVAIDQYGKLTALAGPFAGMKLDEARPKVVELLQSKGLVDRVDASYQHAVKVCYKCGRTIEPRILPQWFVAVSKAGASGKALAPDAVKAVEDGRVTFVTERFRKLFDHWMGNIRDWNVSRQIVWGIRLPVWYCACGGTTVRAPSRTEVVLLRHGEAEHNVRGVGNGDPSKPYPITETGRRQAAEAIARFKEQGLAFDAIYASAMPRVQETAALVAAELGGTVETDGRLNDVGLGGFEGQPLDAIHAATGWHTNGADGSETFDQVVDRLTAFLADRLQDAAQPERILVVTSEIEFWALRRILDPTLSADEARQERVGNGETRTAALGELAICTHCGQLTAGRDTDVFDTWFSSGQLPVILPETTGHADDAERFYPTSVMETGWDIIFFWVARMLMFGLYRTQEVPFRQVYFHGMVRDKDRQKMSKSKGNVTDPLAVIDQYGTDALRLALVFNTSAGNDMPMSDDKVRGMRNFANKLWNISRFILLHADGAGEPTPQTEADRTILARLDAAVAGATHDIETFRFHEASQRLYSFVWDDLAATYLEASKAQLEDPALAASTKAILLHCLATSLKLLHPIMPFVTEAIWQRLPDGTKDAELLAQASWPKAPDA